jgi:hypothetical protein
MDNIYIENTLIKRKMAYKNHEKHLMWQNHRIFRKIALLLVFIIFFASLVIINFSIEPYDNDFPKLGIVFILSMVIVMPFGVIIGIYNSRLTMYTSDWSFYKKNEKLKLTNDKNINDFNYFDDLRKPDKRKIIIDIPDIKELVYNEYYGRINIYCNHKSLAFKGVNTNKITKTKIFKDGCVRIYKYFDNFDNLKEDLKLKTGHTIKIINEPEKNPTKKENYFYSAKGRGIDPYLQP